MAEGSVRVIFMGSDPIALPLLDYLYAEHGKHIDLFAIFTQPDRPQGRGKYICANPIKTWALAHSIPVYQPEKLDASHANWLKQEAVDLACVMAYGQILKKDFLEALPLGAINWHGSLLPKYRGASPIETALLEGETESGLSLMTMTSQMDAGPIIGSSTFSISALDSSESLRHKASYLAVDLIKNYWIEILRATAVSYPQNSAQVSYTRKLKKEDAWLDFDQDAQRLVRQIRALNPWPGTQCQHQDTLLKIHAARALDSDLISHERGKIVAITAGSIQVSTAKGVLAISHLQRPGGKILTAKDFLNAYPLQRGDILRGRATQAFRSAKPFKQNTTFDVPESGPKASDTQLFPE